MGIDVPQVYCVCGICTAKWFCDTKPTSCPRCGRDQVNATRAVPPWLRRNPERKLGAAGTKDEGAAVASTGKDV